MPSVDFRKMQQLVLNALADGESYTIASLTFKMNKDGTKIHRSTVKKALDLIMDSQSANKVIFEWPRKFHMVKKSS